MARGKPFRVVAFAPGLNTADGVFNLADGMGSRGKGTETGAEARDLLNVVPNMRGGVRKRDGAITIKSRAGVKDFSVVDEGASGRAIYSTDAGALYTLDAAGTETAVATGLDTAATWKWLRLPTVSSKGPYIGMNGVDPPKYIKSDLTIQNLTATSGTLPNGNKMVYAGNRLWVIPASDPYAVVWSEVEDPTTWPAANITRFQSSDGKPLTGIAAVGNYVLIFKERDVWAIYNLNTSANRRITDEVGTLSPNAIVSTDQGCFFLDPAKGVMVTDGNQIHAVSDSILPTLRRISRTDAPAVTATFYDNHLYLGARFDGTTRLLLDYHQQLGSWWLHDHQSRALTTWDRGAGRHLISANPDTIARLFVPGELRDEGAIFNSSWSGPFHDFGSSLQKRCTQIAFDGKGCVDVQVLSGFMPGLGTPEGMVGLADAADGHLFGGTGPFGQIGTFAGGVLIGHESMYSPGVGRVFSITVSGCADAAWEMDAYTMWMMTRKD